MDTETKRKWLNAWHKSRESTGSVFAAVVELAHQVRADTIKSLAEPRTDRKLPTCRTEGPPWF